MTPTAPCDLTDLTDAEVIDLVTALAPHAPRRVVETSARAMWDAIVDAAQPKTLYGCIVPRWGFPYLQQWETDTGVPLGMIRCYPAGKTGLAGLDQVHRAIDLWPGTPIFASSLQTGRGVDRNELARAYQAAAKKSGHRLLLAVDAEPDRKDRAYSTREFCAELVQMSYAVHSFAPDVDLVLNLTGYDFAQRIGAYDSLFLDAFSILGVDPYWRIAANAVQAREDDLDDTEQWCQEHGKRLVYGEWGAERGPGQGDRLAQGFDRIRRSTVPVEMAPYFEGDGGPFPSVLDDRAPYRQLVTR